MIARTARWFLQSLSEIARGIPRGLGVIIALVVLLAPVWLVVLLTGIV